MRSPPMRMLQIGVGAILMLFGPLILGPTTPGPFGLLSFGAGLVLLLRNSRWARRRYVILKRRHPRFGKVAELALRRRRGVKPPAARAAAEV
jgi:hypothetical protein